MEKFKNKRQATYKKIVGENLIDKASKVKVPGSHNFTIGSQNNLLM